MRSLFLLLITLSISIHCISQTTTFNVERPQLLPASPEPSGFVQAGLGKANLSTGAVSASLPIYTIKVRDFNFPISIDYSSQGLKIDEASSRVGTGWILNATGMITRVVKGRPDELATRLPEPTIPTENTDVNYDYYLEASNDQSLYDTQPDEFQFSFNGYSGKFVLDNNYVPRVTATNNLKIDIIMGVSSVSGDISKITITSPDGVKYEFGNRFEKTITHNVVGSLYIKIVLRLLFFLTR